jgi:hypothetical protein
MSAASSQESRDSDEDTQARQASAPVVSREGSSLLELDRRGLLPTAEYPVLYPALGKNGFGLFLYLEQGLTLQTLNRLARCKHNRDGLVKHLLSSES